MQEIVNRLSADDREAQIAKTLLYPYLNHAATMFESGYATRADIDASMRFGCGYPIGPLALIDALGPENVAEGLEALFHQTGDELHDPVSYLRDPASAEGSDIDDSPELRHRIAKVGVVGTGTMASGIVEVVAKAGFDVTYVGRSDDKVAGVKAQITKSLDKAISRGKLDEEGKAAVLGRLNGTTSQEDLADVDIVVEAIAEDLAIKLELFRNLDRICKPGAILATTTSSLSITDCANVTGRPQDVIGMHFFNPAPIMKLVEVVTAEETSSEVAETVRALCLKAGKHPVS
ncbi:MAG: 3-hydroxyacyl-CoA dehydrogenase NAD-binding domain-containing protein, partial [Aeromicrobium sp.]